MASKSTKKQQVQQVKNTAAVSKASSIDLAKTLNALAQSSVSVQATISGISEEIVQKHAELKAVDDAISLKKQEMETLHGVDQILLTTDEARAQHAAEVEKLAQERQQIENDHQALQNQRQQERDREEEDYNYNLQQKRRQENDQWLEQVRTNQNNERDRREKFEKDISTREEALRAKETDYQTALAKLASFDADVKKESDRAVAIALSSQKKDYEHQIQLTKVQQDAEVSKLKHDNERLVQSFNNVEAQLKETQAQLAQAYAKNNELAAKAVEGAANTKQVADLQSLITNVGGNGTRART